jgi:cyclophilin family peptidyl-prolyl cis-trans isomerase
MISWGIDVLIEEFFIKSRFQDVCGHKKRRQRLKGNIYFIRLKSVLCTMIVLFFFSGAAISGETPVNPTVVIKTSMGAMEVELFADAAPETVVNFLGLAEGSREFTDPLTGKKVRRPFYDGLVFHRVIKDFMIQGGCPLGKGTSGPGYQFPDEIDAVSLGLDGEKAVNPDGSVHPFLMVRSQDDFRNKIFLPLIKAMEITSKEVFDKRKAEIQERLSTLTVKDVYEFYGYRYSRKGSGHAPKRGSLAMANSGPNTNGSQFFINIVDTPWLTGKHTVFGKVVKGMDVVDKIASVAVSKQNKPVKEVTLISIKRVQKE